MVRAATLGQVLTESRRKTMAGFQGFSTARARSYLFRLPLFTRVIILLILVLWIPGLQAWGGLIPDQVTIKTGYRLTTFPLIHLNILHALLNVIALTPLLERFESEYGTLTTLALFFGPLTTVPALMYLVIERLVFRANHTVMGASIWVFLLLGMEAIRNYRTNPHLIIATHHIPTWTTPLLLALVVAAIVPNTSLLGHICGVLVGYIAGLGYVKYIAPPDWILRWIEGRFNLLVILPHYVNIDKTTYGRFGVLPSTSRAGGSPAATELVGSTQRLGP